MKAVTQKRGEKGKNIRENHSRIEASALKARGMTTKVKVLGVASKRDRER